VSQSEKLYEKSSVPSAKEVRAIARRVSALESDLLRLPELDRPAMHIVSSVPKHVFADSISLGARYRNANIDPIIVEPLV
jgi:hypothetical protein